MKIFRDISKYEILYNRVRVLHYFIFFFAFFLSSCDNPNKLKQNEISIHLEDTLKSLKGKNIDTIAGTNEIIGYWFVPHSAKVNIRFFKNGRFNFNDYNLHLDSYELLVGKYELSDSTLILLYDDRPQQKFKFYKDDDDNYYIKKKGYYFAKGDRL